MKTNMSIQIQRQRQTAFPGWWLACVLIGLLPLRSAAGARENELEKIRETAEQAYIFAYPMLENYRTMYLEAIDPASETYFGWNQVHNNTNLAWPGLTDVVRPNNDTLYSTACLDLRSEPMVLSVPPISNRYYSFQLVDLYTFNFGYIGTRTTGTGAGRYLVAGPAWKGQVPPGIAGVFCSEGNFVYALARTEVNGQSDLANVMAIQAQYNVQPLSHYLGQPPPHPAQFHLPYGEFPVFDTNTAFSVEFIGCFNFLLGQLSIYPTEKTLIASFARIGVGPARPFNSSLLRPDVQSAIEWGVASGYQKIQAKAESLGTPSNGWQLPADIFGSREKMAQVPDEYLVRAAAAYLGLYGNDLEEAYYPSARNDGAGQLLNGTNTYTLHFQPDQIPPVDPNGFWSITMYGPDELLVDNPINRYSVGSLTGLTTNTSDGSLTIFIGADPPSNLPLSNWLPAPTNQFSLTLRMYLPQTNALSPALYPPPPIVNLNQP